MAKNNCPDCILCQADFNQDYIVHQDEHWLIRHSEETNILGYYIIQTKRHILDLGDANQDELSGYGSLLSQLIKSVRKLTACERIYTFSLAEAVPHYHLHVIPRREQFPRIYKGRGITAYPTSPSAPEELVLSTGEKMKNLLKSVSYAPTN